MAVATPPPQTREETSAKTRRQPPYAVVVLNDNEHTFDYVIDCFAKVFHYPIEKCFQLATTIHKEGRAVVWTGALEHAELKKDQIQGMGPDKWARSKVDRPLGVDLEPLA